VLARLLSDANLRAEFASDRVGFCAAYPVDTRTSLLQLDCAALERQARTLLSKRLHEVGLLAPRTCALCGPNLAQLFDKYAQGSWPTSHLRHLVDAVQFARWLRAGGYAIDKSELAHCELQAGLRKAAVCFPRINGKRVLLLSVRTRREVSNLRLWLGP